MNCSGIPIKNVAYDENKKVFYLENGAYKQEASPKTIANLINNLLIAQTSDGRDNTGYLNLGYANVGDHNEGEYNRGSFNKGESNYGLYNNGMFNIGMRNKGAHCVGICCTKTTPVFVFNKLQKYTLSELIDTGIYYDLLRGELTDKVKELEGFDQKIWDEIYGKKE